MGPFTEGPIPEVRMPCGPGAGLDGKRLLRDSSGDTQPDWKPLGLGQVIYQVWPR